LKNWKKENDVFFMGLMATFFNGSGWKDHIDNNCIIGWRN